MVGTHAHADEHVRAEGDHAGGREIDARLHDHEHLPERRDREDRHVREDVGPRRVLERAGCEERGDDDERRHREPDGEETSCDERTRNDLRGAPHRRGVGNGIPVIRGTHGPRDPERQNGEERAATRSPFCAPRARGVNRDRTKAGCRSPNQTRDVALLAGFNPLQHGELLTWRRLTLPRGGVYARCTSGSAARCLTRHCCSAGQGECHELAAPRFPERVRRLDGPRHRRDPERRSPRGGRRHHRRRFRPRRLGRGGGRCVRDDRHAGIRGYTPAHLADARARRPSVLHARRVLRCDAGQPRRPVSARGRARRQLRGCP